MDEALLSKIKAYQPVFWRNFSKEETAKALKHIPSEVELANPVPVLENILSGGAYPVYGAGGAGFGIYYFENENAINVSNNTDIATLAIENPTSSQAIIGALIVGQASTSGTLSITLAVGSENTAPVIKQAITPGWNTITIPKMVVMNSGPVTVKFSASISNSTFSIPPRMHRYTFLYREPRAVGVFLLAGHTLKWRK